MSSEGSVMSVSSRVRELGLYRGMEARTEDFLRLSKRRQLRQGCVCAALSTALTVTLVITVLLVYEYSLHPQTTNHKKHVLNPKWLGFSNDTDDIDDTIPPILLSDKATVKLLPLLLKALTNNAIKTIINDSNTNDTGTKALYDYDSLVPNDHQNNPRATQYVTKLRTMPITYFRHPMKTKEYYSKYKKLRDYKRILNYFHKMISDSTNFEKVSLVKRDFHKTESPLQYHTTRQIKGSSKHEPVSRDNINSSNCTCFNKLGLLLSKLIASLNEIIPHLRQITQSCHPLTAFKNKENLGSHSVIRSRNISNKIIIPQNDRPLNVSKISNKININHRPMNNIQNNTSSYVKQDGNIKTYTVSRSKARNVMKTTSVQTTTTTTTSTTPTTTTTTSTTTVSTDVESVPLVYFQDEILKAKSFKKFISTSTEQPKDLNDSAIYKLINKTEQIKEKTLSTEEYEEYFNPTQTISTVDFVDEALSLMRNKINDDTEKHKYKDYKESQDNLRSSITNTMFNKVKNQTIMSAVTEATSFNDTTTDVHNDTSNNDSYDKYSDPTLHLISAAYEIANTIPNNETKLYNLKTVIKNSSLASSNGRGDLYTVEEVVTWDNFVVDDEKFTRPDEFQENDLFKLILNDDLTKPTSKIETNETNTKSLNLTTTYSSMIPQNKPAYLEIQREWKHDEQTDFDEDNINNNIYDFLNP